MDPEITFAMCIEEYYHLKKKSNIRPNQEQLIHKRLKDGSKQTEKEKPKAFKQKKERRRRGENSLMTHAKVRLSTCCGV